MNKSLGALALLVCFCARAFGTPLEEISDKTYPLSANGSLTVHNSEGIVYIYSWMENAVRVVSRKRAYKPERLQGISADVSIKGDSITIETTLPPKPSGLSFADRSGTMDYVIFVPQKANVTAELATGELIVDGIYGDTVNARLTNGRLTLENCFASTHASVTDGALDIIYGWCEPRRFSFNAEIAHGHARLVLPAFCMFQVDAESADGKIFNQFARDHEPAEQMGKSRIVIGDGNGAEFKLHATHGNVGILKNE